MKNGLKEKGNFMGNENIYALNLFFTGKCNLSCRYCFVDKKGIENTTLNENSLKKSIDVLFSFPGRKKTISFNGGEPTLEWPLVKKIYTYALKKAKEKKIILDVAVMTNGTLLNQEIMDFFIKNKTIVKISIDGNKLTHDKNRPFKENARASSFDKILKNIGNVKSGNLRLAASLVFTPKDLDKFLDNVKFLNSRNFYYIEFYPDLYADWQKKDLEKFKKVFNDFFFYYTELFKEKKKIFKISLLDNFVNELETEKMEKCGKIHLSAQGEFYACDKVFSLDSDARGKYAVGGVKEGVNSKKRSALLNKLRENFLKESGFGCKKCEYYKYCFCPLGHYIYHKSAGKNFPKSFCEISKTYNEVFLKIKDKLKHNPDFVKLYKY